MANVKNWKKLDSKYLLTNPWYKVRQDTVIRPDGKKSDYNIVECGQSAFIVPVTDEHKILLVRLFRYTTQHEGWEIPAGSVEEGEKPLKAAKRELQEETGLTANTWGAIGTFDAMNGISDAVMHIFIAKALTDTHHDEQEEEGISDMQAFSYEEIIEMLSDGRIVDALTVTALLQYFASQKMIQTAN